MFNGKALVHLLREAGFRQPEVSDTAKSAIPEIDQIELEVRRQESLYVEAEKRRSLFDGINDNGFLLPTPPRQLHNDNRR